MIKVGTDIVEISRFSKMKDIELFKKHTFTKREKEYFETCKNQYESIAGAFAAKEAFAKYLGSGFRGFGLRDIEVLHDELDKPYLVFMGKKLEADVSISHSGTNAVAQVSGEGQCIGGKNMEMFKSYHKFLPRRHCGMHKGDCGKVLVVAGSVGMSGAAVLSTYSALRSGSGLVTAAIPKGIYEIVAKSINEAMTIPLKETDGAISKYAIPDIEKALKAVDVCAIGPGLSRKADMPKIVEAVLLSGVPCVVDADALYALKDNMQILKNKKGVAVLTPHPMEMSRLTGYTLEEIEKNREKVTTELAREYNVIVVLKGHKTVIASPSGETHINTTGNNGMATGGSGDVLTGIIASFIGQGVKPYEAVVLSVFLHGMAGDVAAEKKGEFSLIAGDIIEELPFVIKSLAN